MILLFVGLVAVVGQEVAMVSRRAVAPFRPAKAAWILPATLIGSGVVLLNRLELSEANALWKVQLNRGRASLRYVDDGLQYAPSAVVLALQVSGVEGRASRTDFFEAAACSALTMALMVNGIKSLGLQQRPDSSSYNSFVSGHTATAFMGAELLRIEYGARYPWVAATGYLAAIATGYLRIYHNRHWMSDVLAGAGVGIASTWIGYLLQPYLHAAIGYVVGLVRPRGGDFYVSMGAVGPDCAVGLSVGLRF